MANIKIERSGRRVTSFESTKVSAAALPVFQIGSVVESGFNAFFKPIKDAAVKTKKTQDGNDARALLLAANKKIILEADKYKNSSNVIDVESFFNNTKLSKFEESLKPYNKEVKKIFATELYKTTNDIGMKLFANILKRHGELTIDNKKKDLFNLNLLEASNDPIKRSKAIANKELFFNNPENENVFGKVGLNKLKEESIIETKLMQYSFKTKNNPTDILLLGEKNIANDLANEALAKQVIQNAKNTLISQSIKEDKINEINFKADKDQKINNFAYILQKLNTGDIDITLDNINDLYKKDQLNSSQRDALYELYSNPTKLSDQNIIDMIEGAMLIAETVEEIDILKEQILSNPDYVAGLGITDFAKYNSIFEKYQKDLPAFTEYKTNMRLLEADLGKITNNIGFVENYLGIRGVKPNEKLRIVAVDYYKELVMSGTSPADAYIQTTKSFLRGNNIPPIKSFTNLSAIILNEPTDLEKKNPSLYIENRTKELTELYKNGSIDINTFSNDLSAIDSVDELIKLRIDLGEDPFGFEQKTEDNKLPDVPQRT
jgi:uncharacterized protein YegP (UPF0339 family)